jgi:2-methylisocitrate lyase-like PEP mutase family enzyme
LKVAIEVRTVCDLPLILDGAAGWGDPMHMHRTIGMTGAAGLAAIEIEDQIQQVSVDIDKMIEIERRTTEKPAA